MKIYTYIFIITFFTFNNIFAQNTEKFKKLTNQLSIEYKPTSLSHKINTSNIKCDYVLSDNNNQFEILYTLIPIDRFKNNLLNSIYKNVAIQNTLKLSQSNNISDKKSLITEFEKVSVSKEFNADWGGTSSIVFTSTKFCNYKFCLVLYLYKQNKGLIISYFLFNDENIGLKKIEEHFHDLSFKK